jgi:membrane protein
LTRTALAFDQDDAALMARSIAYYALFSLFPLLLILVAFASTRLAVEEAQEVVLQLAQQYLRVSSDLLQQTLERALEASSTVGVLALVGLLWSASGVFSAVYRAINRAWGNPKSQLFWAEKLFGLAVVLVAGLLLLAMTVYSTIVRLLQGWQPLPGGFLALGSDWLSDWLSTLVPLLVSVVTLIVLYRTVPRNRVSWRDVWLGGVVAGLIWEVARRLFAWYLATFSRYSILYGSVGAIIGFLLWSYVGAQIVVLGAEFTAQYHHWRQAGRPLEPRPPRQWIPEWLK